VLESSVQNHLEEYARDNKCLTYRLTLPGRRGWPDTLIITRRGVHGWAETKKPKGGKISPHQREIEEELIGNFCNHAFIKTKEEAENFVNELLDMGC